MPPRQPREGPGTPQPFTGPWDLPSCSVARMLSTNVQCKIEWDSKDHSVLSLASSGTKSSLADGVSIHSLPGKPPHCLATSSPGKSSLQPSLAAHNLTGPLPRTLTGREDMEEPSQDNRLHEYCLLGGLDNPPLNKKSPTIPRLPRGIFYEATESLG